eukprot:CAMPEP_0198683800 /NCGR_PEP_ID=MMETSP1468-20131203/11226_1 /TAXON_ID=1461545 /ORGANISM="Mantoniella sp, Strain CCMP1436" /LENGTH=107 /DNA_ID=CAMNT_0044428125 /DNA_START=67 /DNA_END=390 /DNA_ORIENTATION=-
MRCQKSRSGRAMRAVVCQLVQRTLDTPGTRRWLGCVALITLLPLVILILLPFLPFLALVTLNDLLPRLVIIACADIVLVFVTALVVVTPLVDVVAFPPTGGGGVVKR